MSANFKIPESWRWTTVGDISKNIQYGYTESATEDPIGPKFLRISDIQDGEVDWDSTPYCEITEEEKEKYLLEDGDILFARTGGTVGKSFLIQGDFPESVFASYLIRVQFLEKIDPNFVYYYFQTNHYWRQISEGKKGIGQPNVNSTVLSQLEIPLPSLSEQKHIVNKIDEIFSKLDASVNELKKALEIADQLRLSTLRRAFSGELITQGSQNDQSDKITRQVQFEVNSKLKEQENVEETFENVK